MSVTLDKAIADELARLEQAVADAEKKVEDAQKVAASEDLQNEVLADQSQGLVDLNAFVEDELRPLGLSAIIDPRGERIDERPLEDIYDSGTGFDDVRDRLINLLEISGVRITHDVAMFGLRRPQRITVQEIANLSVRQIIEWLEGERLTYKWDWQNDRWVETAQPTQPDVPSASDVASQQLNAAEAELAKAESDLEAFGDTPEEQQGWLREKGVITAEDLPVSEREGFEVAEPSAAFVPSVFGGPEVGQAQRLVAAAVEDEEPAEPEQVAGFIPREDRPLRDASTDVQLADGEPEVTYPGGVTADDMKARYPWLTDEQAQTAADDINAGEASFEEIDRFLDGAPTLGAEDEPAADGVPADPVDVNVFAAEFGYGARFLTTDPNDALFEVAELLRQAAAEGWDLTKLEQELAPTTWWQETVPRARGLQMLESTDPAAARVKIDKKADILKRKATSLGLIIDEQRLRQMARDYYIEEWTDYQANQNMLLEANWEPGQAGGIVEDNYRVVDIAADDWMVSHLLDEEARDAWAERLTLGDETAASMDAEFSRLAQSAFPLLSDRIGKGFTVKEILSPYRMEIGNQLDLLDTNAIDFLNDPKYSPILYGSGGAQGMMTISDLGEYIRTDPKTRPLWEQTDTAKTAAQSFADFIAKKFGGLG